MSVTLSVPRAGATAGAILADTHEGWMCRVADTLRPVLDESADFWSRWAAARYLDDRFAHRFRLERRLLQALAPLLEPGRAETLAEVAAHVERTALELTAAGRYRETRPLVARLARRLIDGLALWCVEVELATAEVDPVELPEHAATLLSRLRAADLLGC